MTTSMLVDLENGQGSAIENLGSFIDERIKDSQVAVGGRMLMKRAWNQLPIKILKGTSKALKCI